MCLFVHPASHIPNCFLVSLWMQGILKNHPFFTRIFASGGSLATGGFGMAGGQALLTGIDVVTAVDGAGAGATSTSNSLFVKPGKKQSCKQYRSTYTKHYIGIAIH